jgi:hypothetical protein
MTTPRADAIEPFQVERGRTLDTHCIPVEANSRALHAFYTTLREAAIWGHRKPTPHATRSQLEGPQVKETLSQKRSP